MTPAEALGPLAAALAEPFLDPGARTFLPWLVIAAALAGAHHLWRGGRLGSVGRAMLPWHLWAHPSSRLDLWLLVAGQLTGVLLGLTARTGAAFGLAAALVGWLDRSVGVPDLAPPPAWLLVPAYSAILFVAWDASRFLVHLALHRVPALWELHQVHHSAEVLTPLTFHRVHPLESALMNLRGLLVDGALAGLAFWLFRGAATPWTLLGVHGLGLLANATFGNLRHSQVWLRYPDALERWLLSPAQHQLHHSVHPADGDSNFGTWLAVWDRALGTLRPSPPRPPEAFGLDPAARNHAPDDLVGALLGPLRGLASRARGSGAAALLLALPLDARGQEPAPPEDPQAPEEEVYEVVVTDERGVPRVAGSAHVVTEEELVRYGYTDVQKVLARVPGVYTRTEDGYGLRPNIGLRGANSDRSSKVALMEDGIPLAPAPYAAPAAYYFPMTQRMVGIEVFKGPSSIQHGPQTVGGAINVRTRPTPTEGPDGLLDLALGQRSMSNLHAWAGTGDDRWGVLLEGVHLATDGFKELDGGGPTGFVRQDAMLKVRRSDGGADLRSHLELKLGYGRESSHETYLGLTRDDLNRDPYRRYAASQDDLMTWDRTQAEASWTLRSEAVEVRAVTWHHWLGRTWTKLNRFAGGPDLYDLLLAPPTGEAGAYQAILAGEADTATPEQELLVGTNDRAYHSGGVGATGRWGVASERVSNALEGGLRLMVEDVVRVHTEDPFAMTGGDLVATGGPTATTLDSHASVLALAAHAQDDLGVGPLHLIPGARVEWIRGAEGTTATGPIDPADRAILLPGLGASLAATREVDLFAGVHRGFSPVSPGAEPGTLPELSTTWEAGVRAAPGRTYAEVVGFLSDYANLAGQCTLSAGCLDASLDDAFSAGEALVVGVETVAEQRARLPGELDLLASASLTWTDSRFRNSFQSDFPQWGSVVAGDALPYVPALQGGGQLALEHPRGSLALAASGRGPMRDMAGQGEIPEEELLPPVWILDLSGAVHLSRSVTAHARLTNLADRRVVESLRPFGARPSAPFQALVGVRLSPGAR